MSSLCAKRLHQERVMFKKRRPFGFFAKFTTDKDGAQNIMKWNCGIQMPKEGPWEGAVVHMTMDFSPEFPGRPPKCVLDKIDGETVFHPNIYPSGAVYLSILNEDKDWKPTLTVLSILISIRDLLGAPNPHSPAQEAALLTYNADENHNAWKQKVKEQATKINNGTAYKSEKDGK